jgi:anthranilate phosphoribosyltransferase
MQILLAEAADPIQVGAFLMLLRYRGEDPVEIAGLVEGARATTRVPGATVDLDWPSYGAGRTRGAPWFLLAALALAASGVRVLMHGTNEFSGGTTVEEGLAALGMAPSLSVEAAQRAVEVTGFAYLPIGALSPGIARLLGVRRLLGLRSPVNTMARLLNPADAPASVDGVFHPPYIEVHLAAAELLGLQRLLVLKGGGGEAERNPRRSVPAHIWAAAQGRTELLLPALASGEAETNEPDFVALWHGEQRHAETEARVVGTIALGLLAMGRGGDAEAWQIWHDRGGLADALTRRA